MKASEIKHWPSTISAAEWPKGVLENMDSEVIRLVFDLRAATGIPMWPSKLYDAHVRPSGTSQHSLDNGNRQSTATDMHVSTHTRLAKVFDALTAMPAVGGIGLYFDTNTPMFHMDTRAERIMWVRDASGEYHYFHKDPIKFYKVLGDSLCSL